jgi:hypothetical protein
MKRLTPLSLALALAILAQPAQAQEKKTFGGGFRLLSPLFLANQKSVQEDLKMTDDQAAKVKELQDKGQASFAKDLQGLSQAERLKKLAERNKANEQALAGILKADQLKRLKQILLQVRGNQALQEPEVAEALKLTDDQKQKIKAIQAAAFREMRPLARDADDPETMKKLAEIRKATQEKVVGVLTDSQKATWKEMTGEPFKGKITVPRQGGRGGQPSTGAGPVLRPFPDPHAPQRWAVLSKRA